MFLTSRCNLRRPVIFRFRSLYRSLYRFRCRCRLSLSFSFSYYPFNFSNNEQIICFLWREKRIDSHCSKLCEDFKLSDVLSRAAMYFRSINETRTDQAITRLATSKKKIISQTPQKLDLGLTFSKINSIWISHVLIAGWSQNLSQRAFHFSCVLFFFRCYLFSEFFFVLNVLSLFHFLAIVWPFTGQTVCENIYQLKSTELTQSGQKWIMGIMYETDYIPNASNIVFNIIVFWNFWWTINYRLTCISQDLF